MKQGLGDRIENFTKATGIKKVVDTVSQGLNIPCGTVSTTFLIPVALVKDSILSPKPDFILANCYL